MPNVQRQRRRASRDGAGPSSTFPTWHGSGPVPQGYQRAGAPSTLPTWHGPGPVPQGYQRDPDYNPGRNTGGQSQDPSPDSVSNEISRSNSPGSPASVHSPDSNYNRSQGSAQGSSRPPSRNRSGSPTGPYGEGSSQAAGYRPDRDGLQDLFMSQTSGDKHVRSVMGWSSPPAPAQGQPPPLQTRGSRPTSRSRQTYPAPVQGQAPPDNVPRQVNWDKIIWDGPGSVPEGLRKKVSQPWVPKTTRPHYGPGYVPSASGPVEGPWDKLVWDGPGDPPEGFRSRRGSDDVGPW